MFKKLMIITIAASFAMLASGCSAQILPTRMEIDDLMMINAVGVDKAQENPENICVTIISKEKTAGAQGGKSSGKKETKNIILSNEAATFLDAERAFQTFSDKQMFWGHVEFYLIGEEAAKSGIAKYIDFLSRDHETRGNSKVYIIKGTTAKDFINQSSTGEYYMPDRLKAIGENSKLIAGSQELMLVDFLQWLNSKKICAVAPVLSLKSKEKEKKEGEQPSMDIDLGGYAVFKALKLTGIIDKKMSRGENYLLNRIITGSVQVIDPNGNEVGLEIISSSCKIKPEFEKGKLKEVKVKAKVSSNIDEVHSMSSIFTEKTLEYLSEEQSKVIKDEIEQVISYAQKNNTDFVDIANEMETKYPSRWVKYEEIWDEIFPNLPISVEVRSKINRTYDIREPNGDLEEEHK